MFLILGEPTLKLGKSGPKLGLLETVTYSNAGNTSHPVIASNILDPI